MAASGADAGSNGVVRAAVAVVGKLLVRSQHQSLGPKAHEALFCALELETLSGQPPAMEEWHQAAAGRALSDTESKQTHASQCESSAGPVSPVPL